MKCKLVGIILNSRSKYIGLKNGGASKAGAGYGCRPQDYL
jgi:hypothetical protein